MQNGQYDFALEIVVVLNRTTTVSVANHIVHFAAHGKCAKPAGTYSAANQHFSQ